MPKATKAGKTNSKNVAKTHELESQLKRALADYQNLEKRVEEERKLLSRLSASLLIEKLIPVLENLEKAQAHLKDEGLEMVVKQFKDIFTQEGVEEIAAEGAQFNPEFHEAIETQEGEKENMVVKVLAKGYKIENTVLRHAKVIVTKKKVDAEAEKKAEEVSDFGDYA
ncbi:nucleotide exchange factor GrpE [Candidatus Curtissbacteria bacterium RIFCSPLOWO2_01_FULL_39_62]|uniref:Protein GrpE n=2 Tax=Candidatus Curtissiibacteriota TaxID=1752717 RepID=A0A1F5GA89_9BACT|nr:MAG: nucleotide exchange factor GrpE [Candidatus Curtissbacteria bacterium RIFCSPHIGHO2_01_FULL_39_57]OGD88745.1 MAG: nucleotide exchange factor GrpE [Candidatus Curtissbacteria bacterium RIFCSPHIGHO2_02_FULL_40_16b]OGD90289.1 MAG: nucleotide exchange factor GrpE [Candidatus Curtissbacteria bacterium RIFCSPHIGHO2_12_FULL_38_37]OGD99183.1 MAG: nucleotide exchange factor GrpE [Candidatus Curtissbacteria bacterium RIFCSPLOWO2_02_FULL_40_11]OGE00648.1 MAG: nucleotide exchange factor GrpE [Candid